MTSFRCSKIKYFGAAKPRPFTTPKLRNRETSLQVVRLNIHRRITSVASDERLLALCAGDAAPGETGSIVGDMGWIVVSLPTGEIVTSLPPGEIVLSLPAGDSMTFTFVL